MLGGSVLKLRESIAKKVAWISVVSNILLKIGKVSVGWYGKRDAVFADGIHSAKYVFASVGHCSFRY
jgi:divalent metal cation (Fe/Co/Zn/Cd) transporter